MGLFSGTISGFVFGIVSGIVFGTVSGSISGTGLKLNIFLITEKEPCLRSNPNNESANKAFSVF